MKLRKLVAGQVLLREGDPPGPIYVITAGTLRVFRRDLTAIDRHLDLATLGNGAIIGELGALLSRPRSATVQALEPSTVLEIMPDELGRLAQQHQPLVRVLTNALRERAGLSTDEIARLAARLGLTMPASPADEAASQIESDPKVAVPDHNPEVVFPKMVDCPACGSRFAALTLRARKDLPIERESDFHNLYETPYNPYDYELWVCPNDLYAGLPSDFADLAERHAANVAATVAETVASWDGQRPDFLSDRSIELRERSLELALALYTMRDLAPARLAAIAHRLAWCARERGNAKSEHTWLAKALELYAKAYSESDLGGPKEELRMQYLCGELTLRLGDLARACTWFNDALRSPKIKEHASWERMLRDQMGVARERMAAEAALA